MPRLRISRVVRMLPVGEKVREMTSEEMTWVDHGEGKRRLWASAMK